MVEHQYLFPKCLMHDLLESNLVSSLYSMLYELTVQRSTVQIIANLFSFCIIVNFCHSNA